MFHVADEPFVERDDVHSQSIYLRIIEVDYNHDTAGDAVDEDVQSDENGVGEH